MSLRQASCDAVSGILAALSDDEAAALVASSCQQRPGMRAALLGLLLSAPGDEAPSAAQDGPVPLAPRKCARRCAKARGAAVPTPGANGGEYREVAVFLLSGRQVATVGTYGNDLVAVLKAQIANVEGTPVWQQQLLIGDCTLEDQETVGEYCFPESGKGQAAVTLARRDMFIPAAAFQESRPGYEFKHGEYGLGYYAESRDADQGGDSSASVIRLADQNVGDHCA